MTSGPPPEVLIHPDRPALVAAVVTRLTDTITDALVDHDVVHLALTGGGVGTSVLSGLRRVGVTWPRVHLWWSDERFLPAGHADRNETQARDALLDHVDLEPGHVHPMPAADQVTDVDTAATVYRDELARYAGTRGGAVAVPTFAVVLLGVGDDAHVASLFPGLPGVAVNDRSVVGVRDSPKPPPLRVSLTLPAIASSAQVWLLVSGGEKADAVARAFSRRPAEVPAAGVRGRDATVWFLDEAAADQLPRRS